MGLEEFLKPDLWKIVLTLIFIGLNFALFFLFYGTSYFCPRIINSANCTYVYLPQHPCGACAENLTQMDYIYGNLLEIINSISLITFPGLLIYLYIGGLIGITLVILYHYIVACIVVWIYHKLRKKRR